MLQCVAVCCSVLQCVAVRCSALQCVVLCCSMLQCVASCWRRLSLVIACCSVLQCVAVCCSVLQHVAVCCIMSAQTIIGDCSMLLWPRIISVCVWCQMCVSKYTSSLVCGHRFSSWRCSIFPRQIARELILGVYVCVCVCVCDDDRWTTVRCGDDCVLDDAGV